MNARPPCPFPLGELAPHLTAVTQELRHLRWFVLRDRCELLPKNWTGGIKGQSGPQPECGSSGQGAFQGGFGMEDGRVEKRDRRVLRADEKRNLRASEDDALRAAGRQLIDNG